MDKFTVGQVFKKNYVVSEAHTTNRMGKPGADVLSTPSLLGLMEGTCILQYVDYLPENHTSVGYAVDKLRHMAPSALGEEVQITVTLTAVDGNRLTYDIKAEQSSNEETGYKTVAVAIHKRAVIPIM